MNLEGFLTRPTGRDKYWGVEIPVLGIFTQGQSRKNAYALAADAIESLVNNPGFKVKVIPGEANSFEVTSKNVRLFTALVLSRLRKKGNLTAREAAKAVRSDSPNAYSRYERGANSPGLDKFEMLIRAMNPKLRLVLRA